MRTYWLLLASLLFTASSLVDGSDPEIDSVERRTSTSYTTDVSNTTAPVKKPHPPPKKPPTTDSSSSASPSDTSSSSSSASTGGSVDSGSAASGGDTGGSGGSSSSSSGSSSSTSTTSGTGSNGSSSSSGSSASNDSSAATVSSAEGALTPVVPSPGRKNTMLLLGFAAVAGAAIAVATVPKRKVATPDHPLKGALTRRINMFSHLARHTNDPLARPPRRGDDGSYLNADEVMV